MTSTRSMTTVHMPSLGESVAEGTITRWLKGSGDRVEHGEPLLEVATDKVDTEVPSPVAGVLVDILVAEDDVVGVGTDLATISVGSGADDAPDRSENTTATPEPDEIARPGSGGDSLSESPSGSEPSSASDPSTAHEDPTSGSEISGLEPEQPDEQSAPRPESATATTLKASTRKSSPPTDGVVARLPRIRRTIAARMVESLQTSAQLTTVLEVDVTEIARLRRAHKDEFLARSGVTLSFFPFFAKAAVAALAEHRVLNASVSPDVTEITYHGVCHLGIAVDSDKGLMVPVIRDAQDLTIEGLARAIADKADRVRAGTITPGELGGGTFTLTNTGSRGALFDTPIINQPQTGILGIGAVVERVVPARRDDNLTIEVRSMAHLSISYDHRVVDGADAARFLTAVKQRLEGGFRANDLH